MYVRFGVHTYLGRRRYPLVWVRQWCACMYILMYVCTLVPARPSVISHRVLRIYAKAYPYG